MKINFGSTIPATHTQVLFKEQAVPMLTETDGVTALILGKGKEGKVTARTFRTLVRTAVRSAKSSKIKRIAFTLDDVLFPELVNDHSREWVLRTFAENLVIAQYEFGRYKTDKKKESYAAEVLVVGVLEKGDKESIKWGETVGTYVNHSRDLSNTPGGDMTPQTLARAAQTMAKGTKVSVKVLDQKQIEKEKMGALLGVARGSTEEARFVIMEYWGKGKGKEAPVVFVGKGITFDTGGLNLKPSDSVLDMHLDMSGGATVMAAIVCAAKLGLKKNIVALIPAAENMVSGESYRPGDVLISMSGKTIDVLNTDAEGRLVLADGLTYAKRYNPRLVIDVATLTGAALVALGQHASAIMTKDIKVQNMLMELGEESGDYVWPLPLWDEYKQYTKGVFGDLANIPASHGRYGGSINGGMFLSHFAEGFTWAHIDMAPRMTATQSDHLAKGATGEPMRLLLKVAELY